MAGAGTQTHTRTSPRNLRRRLDEHDLEDVRLAVVMSGGVSLAVWIGGVTNEINRLTESAPAEGDANPYAALLDITGSTARVDVIAGTSAGGVNGAFLALAAVHGSSLAPLGALWADKGAFMRLLRSPMQRNPPSLLKGDEYFLPELIEAVRSVYDDGRGYRDPQDQPVDLMITTSLLTGEPRTTTDAFGTTIHEIDHHGLFRFRRGARTEPGGPDDPFADPTVVQRLALASRSTASFPFAFEPSYVPIGPEHTTFERPDMAAVANFTQSGFVIDGGALLNRPIGLALNAIFEQPADRQVRRALAYIDPNPSGDAGHSHQRPEEPPSVRQVLIDSLVTLPRAQSIAKELDELERHNRDVQDRRDIRVQLDSIAGRSADDRAALATALYGTYRHRRIQQAIANVLGIARRTVGLAGDSGQPSAVSNGVPWWSEAELTTAFEAVAASDGLPFIPPHGELEHAVPSSSADWQFGLMAAERLGWIAIDVFRRAMWVAPLDASELRGRLRQQRAQLHAWLTPLRDYRARNVAFWTEVLGAMPAPPTTSSQRNLDLATWLGGVAAHWPITPHTAEAGTPRAPLLHAYERTIWELVRVLTDSRTALHEAAEAGRRSAAPGIPDEADALQRLLDMIFPDAASAPEREVELRDDVMRRLIVLEILHLLLAPPTAVEQSVKLMQISGWTANSFGGPTRPSTKLAGAKLGHFGAFYKQSWRVNDWIWGRIDGATRLSQLVLSPDRLRQLDYDLEEALDAVKTAALGPMTDAADQSDRAWLEERFDDAACRKELAYLADPDLPVPPSLPRCAMAIARRLHLAILRHELPSLVAAVELDEQAGALRQSNGARLRARYEAATAHAGSAAGIPAGTLVTLFASCDIGKETVADDAGSDLFAQTVSQASLVGVSIANAPSSGLGPARVIAKSLRGLMITLYALVAGSVRGGFGNFAVALALSAGGALLAVGLLVDGVPDLLANLGTALVLGGVALAAVRSRLWQFSVFVGLPLVAIVVATWATATWADVADQLGNIAVVGGLVVLSLAVGSLRTRERAPWPVDGGGGWFRRVLVPWSAGVAAIVLYVVVTRLWPDGSTQLSAQFMITVERAQGLVDGWSPDQIRQAFVATIVDIGLLATYWIPIAALNGFVARGLTREGRTVGSAVVAARLAVLASSLALTAAILDAVENLGILSVLHTARVAEPVGSLAGLSPIVPAAISVAAAVKWLFLLSSVIYGVAGGVWWLVSRRRAEAHPGPGSDNPP